MGKSYGYNYASGKIKDSVTFTQKITRKEKPAMNIRWDEEKIQIYQQIH